MFIDTENFVCRYAPILSISPAEMNALKELPDKDKDIILPIIPLRGWVGSQSLKNSIPRIEKAIGDRFWIADIDARFIKDNIIKSVTGKYPRKVFYDIEELLSPKNAYDNWYQYIKDFPKAIPTIQLAYPDQLTPQIVKLNSLGRGVVVRFTVEDINSGHYHKVLKTVSELKISDVFIVFDYGQVTRDVLTFAAAITSVVQIANTELPTAIIAISCSSFPSSFSGYNSSEHSIYERILFNLVSKACSNIVMIYSDRGGARAEKISGGGGIPSPRIDYPLENEWMFIRKEFEDSSSPKEGEKEELYTKIAKEIMAADYWKSELHIWGTQLIEFTSKGDEFGIKSPAKATAVRINIHMHQQLYYGSPVNELIDTDEDWED